MIILNTTINIDCAIEQEWIVWIKERFIPIHNDTGLCTCLLLRVEQKFDNNGLSFALQISFSSKEKYDIFREKYESKLLKLHEIKFRQKFVSFTTLLEEV